MDAVSTIWGSITGSKPVETEQTLEAERRKCNEDIDARLKTLRDAAASPAAPVDASAAPVDAAATMGGGRKRTTKRSRRSKKTKRRRGKRSGKRTRR